MAVRDALVAGCRLERVRERVAEVQHLPLLVVVRVAQAERRLERGAAADELVVAQLPEGLAREQAGLHDLRETFTSLRLGQRLEQRRIDHGAHRPVERADEVLALRDVDRRLAADRRVDLGDEARRHRHPDDAAEVRRGGEACGVRRAAAAERDDRAAPVEAQVLPEPVERAERLRLFAVRELVHLCEPRAERELRVHAVDAGDVRVGDERDLAVSRHERAEAAERAAFDVHSGRGEHGVVGVVRHEVGRVRVERAALLEEPAELGLVLRERAVARADALPTRVDVGVEPDGDCVVVQQVAHFRCRHRAAAEIEDERTRARERAAHDRRLRHAEHALSCREQLGYRTLRARFDGAVRLDQCAVEPPRELQRERGLARAHEPDQRDMSRVGDHAASALYPVSDTVRAGVTTSSRE